jgi:hypothetical protein
MNTPFDSLYVIRLEEILWGALLMAITMSIHALGMLLVLRTNHNINRWFESRKGLMAGLLPVIIATCMILMVHLIEVMVWSWFFIWKNVLPNPSVAYYFALNEYTTLGSNFNLPLQWRLLEGLIATTGLLAFAWSTGVLFTLAQAFQDQQMALFRQRHQKKISKPKAASEKDSNNSDKS